MNNAEVYQTWESLQTLTEKQEALRNPNVPKDILWKALALSGSDWYGLVDVALLSDQWTEGDIEHIAFQMSPEWGQNQAYALAQVIDHPNTSAKVLEWIGNTFTEEFIRRRLASNDKTPAAILEILAGEFSLLWNAYSAALSRNPNTPTNILWELSLIASEDGYVRDGLMRNPSVPENIKNALV